MHTKCCVHSIDNDYLPLLSCLLLAIIKQKNQCRPPTSLFELGNPNAVTNKKIEVGYYCLAAICSVAYFLPA